MFLLWSRRDRLEGIVPQPCWGGTLLAGTGVALFLFGSYYDIHWFEGISLLMLLAAAAVLLGGWGALGWAWPSVGFLVFMLPLPYFVEVGLAGGLQRFATLASAFALQTLGLPALAEGNTIRLNHVKLGVVDACGGLGMLFTFFAFTTGTALVIRRRLPEKVVIVLSAIPIGIVANVTRITATGLLHETVGGRLADHVFHDLAGWLMMSLAMAILYVELEVLSHLFEEFEPTPAVGDFARVAAAPRALGPFGGREV
jgi:exosortase